MYISNIIEMNAYVTIMIYIEHKLINPDHVNLPKSGESYISSKRGNKKRKKKWKADYMGGYVQASTPCTAKPAQ